MLDNLTIVAAALLALIIVVRAGFWWFERRHWRKAEDPPPAKRRVLVCMRLDDMVMVHPEQIELVCERCAATVGVYPSGQQVLRQFKDTEIICHHCATGGEAVTGLAPGALHEPFESVRRR